MSVKFATIKRDGREEAALVREDGVLPLGTDLFSLVSGGLLEEVGVSASGEALPFEGVEYGPLYRRPRKIWGIGLNYTEHARDLDEKAPSDEPASFMRPDTTIIGPGDTVRLPRQSERVTGEAELAVVIGREAKDVSAEEAMSCVAGFTTVIDMTAEDILRKNSRYLTRAKSFDTFFSLGPYLLTPDEVGSAEDLLKLEVSTVLNGEPLCANTVSNMMFPPLDLVAFHSGVMTLLPGDIISTGTPGAVVIREGDVIECRIPGFEPLANPVVRTSVS